MQFQDFQGLLHQETELQVQRPIRGKVQGGDIKISTTVQYIGREGAMKREFVSLVTRTIEEEQDAKKQGYDYVKDMTVYLCGEN